MRAVARTVALLTALCLAVFGNTAVAAGGGADRVGDLRDGKVTKVRIDKARGADRWRTVTDSTRVFVKDKAGNKTETDVDALARGAKVLGATVRHGKVRSITLRELAATGGTDCSFDSSSDEDGDDVSDDESFDCSHDYDDGTVSTDTDCSYDSSRDGGAGDFSLDASWDCSFSETDERDDDEGGLDWDCSFSASADGYSDVDGSDADADLDFDCSWDGAGTDSALWSCKFLPGVLGFTCTSKQLDQEFGYTIDTADLSVDGGLDFQRDIEDETPAGDDGVNCSGTVTDGFECSVDGETSTGDCTVDWSYDRSRATREGDVSGSLSYSCSSDAGAAVGGDAGEDAGAGADDA